MMEKNAKIYVAGHRGMVGSAIVRELKRQGYENIITRTHKELDLCRQDAVEAFFAEEKPEYVFLAAAKVGGIVANQEDRIEVIVFQCLQDGTGTDKCKNNLSAIRGLCAGTELLNHFN